jgi:hypothetical protein
VLHDLKAGSGSTESRLPARVVAGSSLSGKGQTLRFRSLHPGHLAKSVWSPDERISPELLQNEQGADG